MRAVFRPRNYAYFQTRVYALSGSAHIVYAELQPHPIIMPAPGSVRC